MTKEEKSLYQKEYRLKNKEILKEKQRLKYLNNKKEILIKNENYRQNNIDKIKLKRKEHYLINKTEIIIKNLEYGKVNKDKIRIRKKLKRQAYRLLHPVINTGSYNITLAERYKEKWLNESLTFYKFKMIEDDGTIFYKYGLSKAVQKRIWKIPYNVEILETLTLNKYDAVYLEHNSLKEVNKYIPKIIFKGYTECFK